MPALVFVKNDDYGYAKSQKKSVFAVFVFCKQFKKKRCFFENLPPQALLPPSGGCWEIKIVNRESRIKRSPERLLDKNGGFKDKLSYPKLKFGG